MSGKIPPIDRNVNQVYDETGELQPAKKVKKLTIKDLPPGAPLPETVKKYMEKFKGFQ